MADATPFVSLPPAAASGLPAGRPAPIDIGGTTFAWGARTYLMGIINVDARTRSVAMASWPPATAAGEPPAWPRRSRPRDRPWPTRGRTWWTSAASPRAPAIEPVDADEERRRILAGIAALRDARPDLPISVDTRRADVAQAALAAGAAMLNDVAAVTDPSDALLPGRGRARGAASS